MKIAVLNPQDAVVCQVSGPDDLVLVHQAEYQPGDKLVFTVDEAPAFYVIRVDGAMDEAFVYLTQHSLEYAIPFDPENPFHLARISYCPGSFFGRQHYITLRRARAEELKNYRNLAKNVMDQHDAQGCYPHAHANVETRGESLFAARNAIDGVLANTCHYPWPFQSWGIGQREDAELTLEFGRPVDMDELRLITRADFPHDSWWEEAAVEFSDGSREVFRLVKTGEPQRFPIAPREIEWLVLKELKKAPDLSPFPALTQIEVWGTGKP